MKKIYLGLGLLAMAGNLSAQNSATVSRVEPMEAKFNSNLDIKYDNAITVKPKSGGAILWSSDFSTMTDWTIDNDGQTGAGLGWAVDGTSDGWISPFNATVMASTSGGNYAEVSNGDYFDDSQAIGVTYNLTAGPIDLSQGGTNTNFTVNLQFEQWGAIFNDDQSVQVSTDGTNWVNVFDNNDRDAYVGNNPSAIYGNTELIDINIANEVSADPTNVYIRYSWTSINPTATNPATDLGWWTTMGWFIDDVAIVTAPDHEISINQYTFGQGVYQYPYYLVPTTQVGDITFSAKVRNNGAVDQTNTVLTVTADGNDYTSTPVTLTSPNYDSLITTNFTPSATVASYTYDYSLESDFVDEKPSNNTATATMDVTNNIFARDMAGVNGTNLTGSFTNFASQPGQAVKIGNVFEIMADQTLYAADVKFTGTVPTGGALVFCEVHRLNSAGDGYDFVEITEEVYISAANQISGMVTMIFNSPVDLFAGDDILLVVGHYGEDIAIGYSGAAPDNSVLGFDSNNDLIGLAGPVNICVRMNFDASVGVKENEVAGVSLEQNFPNPAKGNTSINYTLTNNSDVTIQITDLTGKVIKVINEGAKGAGTYTVNVNTADLSAGNYFYSLTTENGTVTKAMNVIK